MDIPGHHSRYEQMAVNRAKDDYARALADLLRGNTDQ